MLDELIDSLNLIISQTKMNSSILVTIVITLWIIFFITRLDRRLLLSLGIIPRQLKGLPGILFSPLLHLNFNHLFFNCIPLVVLSNFILINGLYYYLAVTLIITLLTGICVWCFAKPGVHVGASGVITGYWSFLVLNLYQTGTVTTIILGLLSVYYFAGIFFGIFPGKKGVSWESHFFGLLAGLATSYLFTNYPTYVQMLSPIS
ncbi:rhomboid family intramembrane serine protease [Legionella lytica]|uniref:Rhomboid family intramembrane serine protease n=1 Tax=Legionella lytica TaxID=96232 RepID=A0ABW8D7J2_9GAMM